MFVSKSNKVVVEYEGRLESGKVFDLSKHENHSHPLEFVVGERIVIPEFNEAVIGMEKDEKKEITIIPEGKTFPMKIVNVNDSTVSLNLNHPLIGNAVIFKIKLTGVKA